MARPGTHAGGSGMPTAGYRPQEFLHAVRDGLQAALPEPLRAFRSRVVFNTLQVHYGDPRVHYEVWIQRKTGRIEVGLHFEGERDISYGWAALLAPHAHEVRAAVGPDVELEEWTPSWARLHVLVPYQALDAALARRVTERLAALVAWAQPFLRERGVGVAAVPAAARGRAQRRRFRRRRR